VLNDNSVSFDKDLITRYAQAGPRYTSYPTALQFHDEFNDGDYTETARESNEDLVPAPLSLYFHLPFCRRVCFYCACSKIITNNQARSTRYLDSLHKEIVMQGKLFDRDRCVDQLHWGGGTPTYIGNEQMSRLMQVIQKNFTLRDDDRGDYSIEIDPREIGPGTIKLLREIGFNRISIGVQDFNPAVQKAINRIQGYDETAKAVEDARTQGFHSINIDMIYGLPKQTLETSRQTLKQLVDLNPDRIAVYNYAHLPHIFKTQRQINENELPDPETKLNILQLVIDYLTQNGYVYIGMDHFAKADDELAMAQKTGSLHRNFQGYSTHANCDLIGMGVTAISCINGCYAQNARDINEYESLLEQGKLPVTRGMMLDHDDELRRDVITKLICHFNIDFSFYEDNYGIKFHRYFHDELSRLALMEKDSLLSIDNEGIHVTRKGRLLIRNICMVFDKYLPISNTNKSYSKVI